MPNMDKSFTCNLFMAMNGSPSFEALKDEETFEKFMFKNFTDVAPKMPKLMETIKYGPRGRLHDVRCFPWVNNNICLIGDSAHPIFPFYGQGLNTGLEDCSVLLSLS